MCRFALVYLFSFKRTMIPIISTATILIIWSTRYRIVTKTLFSEVLSKSVTTLSLLKHVVNVEMTWAFYHLSALYYLFLYVLKYMLRIFHVNGKNLLCASFSLQHGSLSVIWHLQQEVMFYFCVWEGQF